MKTFDFYGVCGSRYKLDDTVWEAVEDPSDGYRSYLLSIEIVGDSTDIFFENSLGKVFVQECPEYNGWKIVCEKTGHIWLKIGTDYSDSYYPSFRFEYVPKDPNTFYPDGSKRTWESFISDDE